MDKAYLVMVELSQYLEFEIVGMGTYTYQLASIFYSSKYCTLEKQVYSHPDKF